MRLLVFDTGPVITLSVNALLWAMFPLRKRFNGRFVITPEVRRELIDVPLKGKKYKFEALRVQDLINEKVFEIVEDAEISAKSSQLMNLANSCFKARGTHLRIVQTAEIEALAAAIVLKAEALVVDERTTRMLIEQPEQLERLLENKLHADVVVDKENLEKFKQEVRNVNVIRSVELVTVAYKLGLLDRYVTADHTVYENMKNILLYSALWALKLYGAAISADEIDEIVSLEK
jgi:hypothetical protein